MPQKSRGFCGRAEKRLQRPKNGAKTRAASKNDTGSAGIPINLENSVKSVGISRKSPPNQSKLVSKSAEKPYKALKMLKNGHRGGQK
jgi:hypothetical protein